jgi:hypothetical protein
VRMQFPRACGIVNLARYMRAIWVAYAAWISMVAGAEFGPASCRLGEEIMAGEESRMRRDWSRPILGALLVLAGVLLFLQNMGIVRADWAAFWALVFLVAGVAFLLLLLGGTRNWWAAIPGFTLMGLGMLVGLDLLAPAVTVNWGGSIFLGMMGLGFLTVYLMSRVNWWAIIPAGVMITLAVVAAFAQMAPGAETGAILFLGLALTFGLVYLLPGPGGRRMTWALIPAAVMMVLAVVISTATIGLASYIWPAILILAGVYLLYRNARNRRGRA